VNTVDLVESIRRHEGYRAFPYLDTEGLWTVGFGRLLHDLPIPRDLHTVGDLLTYLTDRDRHSEWLTEDVNSAIAVAKQWLGPVLPTLSDARQRVVVEMAYQLGNRLHGFTLMKAALEAHDYDRAADEGLRSRWSMQTPKRARELMAILRTGVDLLI
jgi:lysozyme